MKPAWSEGSSDRTPLRAIRGRGANRLAFGALALLVNLTSAGLGQEASPGPAGDDLQEPRREGVPTEDSGGIQTPLLEDPFGPLDTELELAIPPALRYPRVRLRGGGWLFHDFAADIPGGSRSFSSRVLPTIAADVTVPLGSLFLSASGEYARTRQIELKSLSLSLGVATNLGDVWGAAMDMEVSAGPFLAELEMDEARFGDFDAALGGFGRVDVGVRLGESLRASLWTDLRWAEFEFKETVVSGDESAGGLMVAGGLSLSLSF